MGIPEAFYSEVANKPTSIESSLWKSGQEWIIHVWCAEMALPDIATYREDIQTRTNKTLDVNRGGEGGESLGWK